METLKNQLLYCGLSREEYLSIKDVLRENRRKSIGFFAPITMVIFGVLFIQSILVDSSGLKVGVKGYVYLTIAVLCLLMTIGSRKMAMKYPVLSTVMVLVYINSILMMGVYAGVAQPEERTTLLLGFYVITASLFVIAPAYLGVIYLETEIIYLVLIFRSQTGITLYANVMNTIIFCFTAIVISGYTQRNKFRRYLAEYQVRYLVERDAMTSLYNRFKYESELDKIRQERIPVTVCAFDVNGLKRANDSMGHAAGDELIISAGECISQVFGKYGKVFRTGGDEFAAIMYDDPGDWEQLITEFRSICDNKNGKYIKGVHVSCGMASVEDEFETKLQEAIMEADALMYKDKENYYKNNEIDRRKR